MANERLRAALRDAGIDSDRLAELIGVDVKTVGRWLTGPGGPTPRHRAAVARALGRSELELWPENRDRAADDLRREILGVWGGVDDVRASDWRVLLRQASGQIDLLGHRLDQILGAQGVPDLLSEKASAGCRVRVLLPAPDSLWLAEAARSSGNADEDYIGRTELHRQVELAIGYLQPLLEQPGINAHVSHAELSMSILRFDQDMLLTLALAGAKPGQQPLFHLQRKSEAGMFDRLAAHQDALHRTGSPIDPDPELFPDPRQIPARYQPMTERIYQGQLTILHRELGNSQQASPPASRRKLKRPRPRQR